MHLNKKYLHKIISISNIFMIEIYIYYTDTFLPFFY